MENFNDADSTLRLIILDNCKTLGDEVNKNIMKTRKTDKGYIVPIRVTRFNNGEGKVIIDETIRDKDVYIISDVGNHSCTYEMYGYTTHIGPDEHFQDIKRVISAIRNHTRSITVVTPLLYASRQHKRKGRESLDCAVALQELEKLGVNNIITFDVHDPNVQNAIPCSPFENFYPTHTVLTHFIQKEDVDIKNMLVVSPDTGAMDRARYYADMLKCNVGMFYKRRDLSKIVDGKNPIVAHEYLGNDVEGRDVIVVDDMIASGESMIEVAEQLKKRKVNKVYLVATFALFTTGIEKFNKAYEDGLFNKLYTTNLSYIMDSAKQKDWIEVVNCSSYLADIIDCLNNKKSISPLLNGKHKMSKIIEEYYKNRE